MGGCCSSDTKYIQYKYSPLTKPNNTVRPVYDVVVIGSGYGGAVAASRAARAGKSVCVLEKGREWLPGDFPESMEEAIRCMHIVKEEEKKRFGHPSNLIQFNVGRGMSVMTGSGVGGQSLIDEGIALECKAKVFYDPVWPPDFREGLEKFRNVDKNHAQEMLRPSPYPDDYPALKRMTQMRNVLNNTTLVDIEDLDESFYRTPLYVNFQDAPSNHVGISQAACNGCGNCMSGCNVGAKNTLAMNYIPDAVRHGAEIFAQTEVLGIDRDYENYQWQVTYRLLHEDHAKGEKTIRASVVIIAAGALGSTKLLMNCRQRGLGLSSQLGKKFNGNGGILGVSFHGKEPSNGIGLPTGMFKGKPKRGPAPGPSGVSFIDVRKRRDGFVMEDFVVPAAFKGPYLIGAAIANGSLKVSSFPHGSQWNSLLNGLDAKSISHTLGLYCFTNDEADGLIVQSPDSKEVHVQWDATKHERFYFSTKKGLEEAAHCLGGHLALNPQFSAELGKSVLTSHPLGGCCMGESGLDGVVNHYGAVFIDDTDQTFDGLYVVDGSIIPCALGVNPSFTVTCLAERCLRLLAEVEGWTIDYTLSKAPVGRRIGEADTAI